MSSVRNYATKRKNAKTKEVEGRYLRSNKIIRCSGGSTSSLKSHIHTQGIDVNYETSENVIVGEKADEKQSSKTIDQF